VKDRDKNSKDHRRDPYHVVSDYWVDHREYILLIDLWIVLLRAVFRSIIVLYCKFSAWKCWWTLDPAIIFDRLRGVGADCFCRNSCWSHRSGRELKYRDRAPSLDFPLLEAEPIVSWIRSRSDQSMSTPCFPFRSDRYWQLRSIQTSRKKKDNSDRSARQRTEVVCPPARPRAPAPDLQAARACLATEFHRAPGGNRGNRPGRS
jgi:hypothetical protein